jgi:hypothetical protein
MQCRRHETGSDYDRVATSTATGNRSCARTLSHEKLTVFSGFHES